MMNRRDALRNVLMLPAVASVSVATLRPNDVIVLESDRSLTDDVIAQFMKQMKQVFPDHKVVVLGDGIKMSIVKSA